MLLLMYLCFLFNVGFGKKAISVPQHMQGLLEKKCFIDKTGVVRAFFKSAPAIVVHAPTRFGKTVNMDIIKTFCQVIVDGKGNRMDRDLTKNIFKRHNLSISKDDAFFLEHFGNHPVVFLDFNELFLNTDSRSFVKRFKQLILTAFADHKYLLFSDKLNDSEKVMFQTTNPNIPNDSFNNGVVILCSMLYRHLNEKCVVLIDGYDWLVRRATTRQGVDIKLKLNFVLDFMHTSLFSNPYLNKALINACIKMDPVFENSTTQYKFVHFLRDENFAPFYGFTRIELRKLLPRCRESTLVMIEEMYGGYRGIAGVTVCNPYSIYKYYKFKFISEFWTKADDLKKTPRIFLRNATQIRLDDLFVRNSTVIRYVEKFSVDEILKLRELVMYRKGKFDDSDIDLIFTFLTDLGYLTTDRHVGDRVSLAIPNDEILEFFNYRKFRIF